MLVPEVGLGTGGGVRLLGVNQKLVAETVFVIVGGGGQERHIVPAVGKNLAGRLRRKPDNGFRLLCHSLSLLFLIRFQQPLCGGGDFGDTPGELGDGSLYLRLPRRVEVAGGVAANRPAVTAQAVDNSPQFCPLDVKHGLQLFAGGRALLPTAVLFQVLTQGFVNRCALHRASPLSGRRGLIGWPCSS